MDPTAPEIMVDAEQHGLLRPRDNAGEGVSMADFLSGYRLSTLPDRTPFLISSGCFLRLGVAKKRDEFGEG